MHPNAGFLHRPSVSACLCALILLVKAWEPWPMGDVAGTLTLFALLAALAEIGWRGALTLLPAESVETRLTAAVAIATTAAFVPATLLGHFGWLRPGPFLVAMAALTLATSLLPAPPPRPAVHMAPARRRGWRRLEASLVLGATVAVAAGLGQDIYSNRTLPPGGFGFDDNSFHLATVATWNQRQDLAGVKFSFGDPSTAFYPLGGELASWVLLAPFGDSDFAARWSQLPFFLATLGAMAAVGRRLGLDRRVVLPGVLLYATIERVFPLLALGAGNDHQTTFAAVATADALLLAARRPGVRAGTYAGLACGLLAGTKYLGLIYLGPLFAVGALIAGLTPAARGRLRAHLAPTLLALGLAAFVAGGYGYLRNAVTTGNPVYPQPVGLFGVELLPGQYHGSLNHRQSLPENAIELPGFFLRQDLFGPLGVKLLLPAAVGAPLVSLLATLRRRAATRRRGWEVMRAAVLCLPGAFFLEFLYLVGDHRDSRYLFPAVALAAVGASSLLWRLGAVHPGLRAVGTGLLSFAATWTLASRLGHSTGRGVLIVGVLAAVVVASGVTGRLLAERPRLRSSLLATTAALALLGTLQGAAASAGRFAQERLSRQAAAVALEREVGPEGAAVAYLGYNRPYLFWGAQLQNRVHMVPRRDDAADPYFTWGGSAENPFTSRGKLRWWLANLDQLGIRYLVVERSGAENPERQWMLKHPRLFECRFTDGAVEIWRLQPEPVTATRLTAARSGNLRNAVP